MAAVEDRVQAQANQRHYITKLKEEREKVEAAVGRVNLVQQEFEVSLSLVANHSVLCYIDGMPLHIVELDGEGRAVLCAGGESALGD